MISLFIVEICMDGIVRHHTDPSAWKGPRARQIRGFGNVFTGHATGLACENDY